MIINMTTIAVRKEHYIDQTLESLFNSDGRDIPVNLMLGSADSSHVEKYRDTLNLVAWDERAEAQARAGQMRFNCNINAIRALRYGDDEHCLCCEDDIRFKPDWYHQLMLTIEQIAERDYVLNLGQGCDQSPDKRYAVHTRSALVGAQGIFYPNKALRSAVADYLDENIARGMNDNLVGQYAKKYATLYNTTPTLVGHIGQVSSFSVQPPPPKQEPPPRPAPSEAPPSAAGEGAKPPPPAPAPAAPAPPWPAASLALDVAHRRARLRATAETFLDLLRCSLGKGTSPAAARPDPCDWNRLAQMGADHGLMPTLYGALESRGAEVPAEWQRKFKGPYVANVFHAQLAQQAVDEVGAAFAAGGISLTLLNDAALQRDLYGDPALRVVRSIDVLVDVADVERASARLQLLGLMALEQHDERRPLSHFHSVHRRLDTGTIPVDLYWRPFAPYQPYVFDRDALRTRARALDAALPNLLVMAPEHELALLCLRMDRLAVAHRLQIRRNDLLDLLLLPQSGEQLVWLYDIALYLEKRGAAIDWRDVVDTARRWAIDGHVGATLELVQRLLEVAPPPEVLRDLKRGKPHWADRIAHRAMSAARRAKELSGGGPLANPRSGGSEWLARQAIRFARGWQALFPPRACLRARYADAGTPLEWWARHAREVVPALWAETRERLIAAAAAKVR